MNQTKRLKFDGLTRVMVNKYESKPVSRAMAQGVLPVIAFRRKDGWSLGAPLDLHDAAFKTWPKEWTHFWESGSDWWEEISEYHTWKEG